MSSMKKFLSSLPARLVFSIIIGITVGCISNASVMQIVVTIQNILGSLIFFCVPLIIIGFIAPSITKLGNDVSKVLLLAVGLAYVSSIGAAFMSAFGGLEIIPHLKISSPIAESEEVPKIIFNLGLTPILSVMNALVLSILIGVAVICTKSTATANLLEEFHKIVLSIVTKVITPILPLFVAFTFCSLAYEGVITKQLPIFVKVVLIVIIGHYIWLTVLYTIAAVYSRKSPLRVLKYYAPAYFTALGTMSSAATLPVALESARKSDVLRKDMVDFGIPFFANTHVCGSILTEVFFVMIVSQVYYGALPSLETMIMFCLLLGVFAVGAPGVPGGTVIGSLGLITGVLGFDGNAVALVISIFALQDSFGTACNITGDGALTLILSKFVDGNKNDVVDIKPDTFN
jgi:Na+/H+-dicarboxylate symporter